METHKRAPAHFAVHAKDFTFFFLMRSAMRGASYAERIDAASRYEITCIYAPMRHLWA